MALPNGDRASIDMRKLTDYVLNPAHRTGRHKARVFLAALGLTGADVALLLDALTAAAKREPATLFRQDAHGAHYAVEFMMSVGERRRCVRSLWTIRPSEEFPRFVTAFVAKGDENV